MRINIDLNVATDSCANYYDKAHLDYYNQFSDELGKKPYDKDFLNGFLSKIDNHGRILDVGCCSSAQQARYFHENGYQVTAIDLSGICIETAKQKFPHIDFQQMDMTEMKFESDSFDGINASYSIIHIPNEKLESLFLNFNKILKINGIIAIAVHAGNFYGFFDENEMPVFYRTYSHEELKNHLDNSGFEIIILNQRPPLYDFEFPSDRIYVIAKKIKTMSGYKNK